MRIFTAAVLCMAFAGQSFAATVKGRVVSARIENLENFVVFIKRADPAFFTAPEEPVISVQRDYRFIPRVLPIVRGTGVVFASRDPGTHNIHTAADRPIFFDFYISQDLEYGPVKFDDEGEVMLLCNMHAQMKGYILVLQNPYFAMTGKEGEFAIKGVPAGRYELVTWHEEYKSLARQIVVEGVDGVVETQFRY